MALKANGGDQVALLAEGVDRNKFLKLLDCYIYQVALLAEGVDRNWKLYVDITDDQVALLAEGVDRNRSR